MTINLDKLQKLGTRLAAEESALADALAMTPSGKALSRELLQKLAEISAAQAVVSRIIDGSEPRVGWG